MRGFDAVTRLTRSMKFQPIKFNGLCTFQKHRLPDIQLLFNFFQLFLQYFPSTLYYFVLPLTHFYHAHLHIFTQIHSSQLASFVLAPPWLVHQWLAPEWDTTMNMPFYSTIREESSHLYSSEPTPTGPNISHYTTSTLFSRISIINCLN